MTSGSPEPGRRPNPNLSKLVPGPGGLVDREELAEARRKADRSSGIMLLALGLVVTVMNMSMLTENSLAAQYASVFQSYGIDPYERPAGLGAVSLAGVIGHPVIYAATLYVALVRWGRKRRAMWVIVLGAVVSMLFTFLLVTVGMSLHPELIAAAQQGAMPTGVATP